MRFLALLLLATGVAGACPALAEVTILRGSSAPPPAVPPAEPVVLTQREVVDVPVYSPPVYYVTFPAPLVRHHLPAPGAWGMTSGAAPGVASGWPLFGPSSPRR